MAKRVSVRSAVFQKGPAGEILEQQDKNDSINTFENESVNKSEIEIGNNNQIERKLDDNNVSVNTNENGSVNDSDSVYESKHVAEDKEENSSYTVENNSKNTSGNKSGNESKNGNGNANAVSDFIAKNRKPKFEESHSKDTFWIDNNLLVTLKEITKGNKGLKTKIINDSLRAFCKKNGIKVVNED